MKKQIEEIQTLINEAQEKLNQLKKKPELRTPDNIEFYCWGSHMGIVFNKKEQQLYYESGIYKVAGCAGYKKKNLLLTPIKREDLKPGDTAYRTTKEIGDYFDNHFSYCKILDGKRYAYIFQNDVRVADDTFRCWYKVSL